MKLFTNKFPIIKGYTPITGQNEVDCSKLEIVFEEGKVFKVKCVDQTGVVLECEGKAMLFNADLFKLTFKETEIEI